MNAPVKLHRPPERKRSFADHLADTMTRKDVTAAELARRTDLSRKHISELLAGKVALSPEVAVRLSHALGPSAPFLLTIDQAHRAAQAELEADTELESLAGWASDFPVAELVRRGHLDAGLSGVSLVRAILNFFGTANLPAWEAVWPQRRLAFRRTGSADGDVKALQSWLRLGELKAQRIPTAPYNRGLLTDWVERMRPLTGERLTRAWPAAVDQLAAAGVALVLVEEIKPLTKINGACNWVLPDKVVIQVSGRHKRADILWFSILHEIGHALHDAKKTIYIASDEDNFRSPDDEEAAADRFAGKSLLSPHALQGLNGLRTTKKQFLEAARTEGVGVDIIVGAALREEQRLYSRKWVPAMLRRFTTITQPNGLTVPVDSDA